MGCHIAQCPAKGYPVLNLWVTPFGPTLLRDIGEGVEAAAWYSGKKEGLTSLGKQAYYLTKTVR